MKVDLLVDKSADEIAEVSYVAPPTSSNVIMWSTTDMEDLSLQ